MTEPLDALTLPLAGSRLIEASAGTGKTWTIAALLVRLVLGHGNEQTRFARPLLPSEILVMTFTRAATRELSDRIRDRLIEAARCFRGEAEPHAEDTFLLALLADYPAGDARMQAAWRLATAAEAMDEAAVFTIDAWCQRMLREHAFDSGCLFDEELLADEHELFATAVRDYWRQQVYPLAGNALDALLSEFSDPDSLAKSVQSMPETDAVSESLGSLISKTQRERSTQLAQIKQGWEIKAQTMQDWLDEHNARKTFKTSKANYSKWLDAIKAWSLDPALQSPDLTKTAWERFTPAGMCKDAKDPANIPQLPAEFAEFATLQTALEALPMLKPALLRHAAGLIRQRLAQLKRQAGVFSFADMLTRLDTALAGPNGERLRERIVMQYPLALVDEFQDTSPLQYRIFDRLYRPEANDQSTGLFLIGDPKQSIYAFRGADIHSYLAARQATAGRHYALATNYRSTSALVAAVNRVFARAETNIAAYPQGAFRFRSADDNPLPFDSVDARGRKEKLVNPAGDIAPLTIWHHAELLNGDRYRQDFAAQCVEQIVLQLNDAGTGFCNDAGEFRRLQPADIAVLVRNGKEAEAVRRALRLRGVASVYLSDKDSVFDSQEARDLLRLLCAVANPLDSTLLRAALATATLDLDLAELDRLNHDDLAWEARIEAFKQLRFCWQRQGVLAMLRQWLHQSGLPARLLSEPNGERSLTNLLHLAELLQTASQQQEGEQALIRWLADEIAGQGEGGDDKTVRLESDADLVKVVTVHKSKGLEYALVYLPFACSFRAIKKQDRIEYSLPGDALAKAEAARMQEDLRLLYVALTRARHALWLGVAAFTVGNSRASCLAESAFGYLLAAGSPVDENNLPACLAGLQAGSEIALECIAQPAAETRLNRDENLPPLAALTAYAGRFERDWSLASFSALTRDLAWSAAESTREQNLLEAPEESLAAQTGDAPWHRFPRGAVPGNFLHDQLEWLANEGFASAYEVSFAPRLEARCERLGWGHRKQDVVPWLHKAVTTPLPPLGAPLATIETMLPEMEFWFPSDRLNTSALDALCQQHLLPGQHRPALPDRQVHGLLKGYADLVFEYGGKYWVLDYKSNALGANDAAYHADALAAGMLEHRYDVQAAIYLLALHRLLRQRLGADYRPEDHLGGAIYLFLRGINHQPEAGCHWIPAQLEWLQALDDMLN